MRIALEGGSAFRYLRVALEEDERLFSEAGAMASMEGGIDVRAQLFGGLFSGLAKRFLGGESLFINEYTNRSDRPSEVVLSSGFPGDVVEIELQDQEICLQPGAFLAATEGVDFSLRWGGLSYFLAGEGLFKLNAHGTGLLWITCYGALIEKEVRGEYVVDTGHQVAFDPQLSQIGRAHV